MCRYTTFDFSDTARQADAVNFYVITLCKELAQPNVSIKSSISYSERHRNKTAEFNLKHNISKYKKIFIYHLIWRVFKRFTKFYVCIQLGKYDSRDSMMTHKNEANIMNITQWATKMNLIFRTHRGSAPDALWRRLCPRQSIQH